MLKPRRNYVLIKRDENPLQEKTKGGLFVPTNLNTPPKQTGVLVASGPDVAEDLKNIKVKLQVMFPQHAGHPVIYNDQVYLLMEDTQVIAIL